MMMNISSHFRMMFSPPQPSPLPPSSLRPHQGCRGAQVEEIRSTSAPLPNPHTQACTLQPQPLRTTATSQDTLLPHPLYTTNENARGTRLKNTQLSERESPLHWPRNRKQHPLSCPQSLSTTLALSPGCSRPAEALNPLPRPLHLRLLLHSLPLLRPLLCPLSQRPRPNPPPPPLLGLNSSLLQWRFTGPTQNLMSMRCGHFPKLEV